MSTLLIVIIFLALVFDYINGFHDAANSIATIVSTKVLTPFQAVVWAAFFNFVAFFIFTDHAIANTIAKTVQSEFITLPVVLSGIIAAIIWNLLTWWYGIPSSSSHTLIGGFAGAAIAHAINMKGFIGISEIIYDKKVIQIVMFILLAPLIGMFMSIIITIITVNRNVWLRIGIIIVATIGTVMLFNHFQQVKIGDNLAKFYEVGDLKEAAKTNPAIQKKLEHAQYNLTEAKKIAQDYNKVGGAEITNRIIAAGLVDDVVYTRLKTMVGNVYMLDSLEKKAAKDPIYQPLVDSLNQITNKAVPALRLYPSRPNEEVADSVALALNMNTSDKKALLAGLNTFNTKAALEKQIVKADNRVLRYGFIGLAIIFILAYIYVDVIREPNALRTAGMFKKLQLISSAAFSISHGGNDAQKVMGIIAAALVAEGQIADLKDMPNWVPLACYSAIALGTMSGGWKIIKTMGTKITKVTPLEGVVAETSGAITLFVTEQMGIPVSTTHTITGAIMGVGATKRLSAVRWGVTINLLWAWLLTIPVSAVLAALIFYFVHFILGL
ncbi:MAG: inorganic phosphate transporter [Ferruginibacter sp.]